MSALLAGTVEDQQVVVVSGTTLVVVGLLLLLVIQLLVARWVLRDSRRRTGRVPGLDATMAFGLPLVGVYAYRRSLKDTEAIARGDEPGSSRASTAGGRVGAGKAVSDDLVPRLTQRLKEVQAERDSLAAEVAELRTELALLREGCGD